MADFTRRSTEHEMMDDFSLGSDVIDPIMHELEVVNKLLGGYNVFFNAFEKLNVADGMVISDWGCGGGDSLRVIARWARKKRLDLKLIGLDATASAVSYAKRASADFPEIAFTVNNVLTSPPPDRQYDIVISSLFTHHFGEQQWIELIQNMYRSTRYAIVVNDLHRHWFAYHSIGFLTKVFSRSEMVKHDSQLSVLRSFKRNELENMLKKAGIKHYSIRWLWAFRWQLIMYKNE